jgi:hypothetical protein
MKVVPYRFISAIRSGMPWYVPFKKSVSRLIFDGLLRAEIIEAKECNGYMCREGWCEGLGAGFTCGVCKGTGWVEA